jgi:predicted permease
MSVFGSGESVRARLVSGNYFSVLGVAAAAGRTLTPEDDRARNGVVVISNDLWKRRFGQASSAIGQQVALNGSSFMIVGVTPPGFFGESVGTSPELWLSTTLQSQLLPGTADPSEQRDNGWLRIMGRLKPGIVATKAQSELNLIFQQYRVADFGSTESAGYRKSLAQERIDVSPGGKGPDFLRRQFSQPLLLLMAMVGLVLLIACANTANLLLGRAASRRKEIAMRLAIGATPGRLMRQLLTESVLLSTIAGSIGLLLARLGSQALLLMAARGTNSLSLDATLDLRVLTFTVVMSLATGILFGILPARQCIRLDATPSLKANRISTLATGKLIVVSQVAISLLLLIAGSLFVRSLRNLEGFDPGFRRDSVLVADIDARMAGYKRPQFAALYQRLLDRLSAIPGVRSASLSLFNLMSNSGNIAAIFTAGRAHQDKDSSITFH